jgi:four helix bundle protein
MVANNYKEEFKRRSKDLARRTLLFVDELPNKPGARVIANQLGRSAASVAANYRAACRARSAAEFLAKLGIVEEEGDESLMWLELAVECGYAEANTVSPLSDEMNELLSMTVASIKTARRNANLPDDSAIRNPKSKIK